MRLAVVCSGAFGGGSQATTASGLGRGRPFLPEGVSAGSPLCPVATVKEKGLESHGVMVLSGRPWLPLSAV